MECPSGAFISVISPETANRSFAHPEYWSGIVNDQILVYDYAEGTGYDLSDRGNFDYVLTVQEDSLIAEKRAYQEDALIESGELDALGWYSSDKTPMIASPL